MKSIANDFVIRLGLTSQHHDSVWCWVIFDKTEQGEALLSKGTIQLLILLLFVLEDVAGPGFMSPIYWDIGKCLKNRINVSEKYIAAYRYKIKNF